MHRNDAGLAQAPCRQPQHFGAAALHRKIVECSLVRAGADAQRPAKHALDLALQHRRLDLFSRHCQNRGYVALVALDDGAGDERVAV